MVNIKKIKKEILYKAFHGELIEPDSKNGNAKDLIAEIKSKLKNNIDEASDISDSFELFDIPENWAWCRLCDIGDTNIGLTYHPENISNNGTIVLRSNNIRNNKLVFDDTITVDIKIREKQYLNKNDILICSRNGSKPLIGKCGIYNGELGKVSFGAFMAVYRTVCYKYVYYYFTTDIFRRYFDNDDTKQINQVTQDILKFAMIPLPPLKEQEIIVNKINELFNILDLISRNQILYNNDIKSLQLKVIQAGVSGQLTEQLENDGNAEDLYIEIQKEREKLIKSGKIKKEKPLPEITDDEKPFDIPMNWKWCRMGNVGQWQAGATPLTSNDLYYKNGTIPWILTGDLHDEIINYPNHYITKKALDETSVKLNPIGAVLIAMYGATIGKLAILNIEATTNQACCACIPFKGVYNRFIFYYLMAIKKNLVFKAIGDAQPNISKEKIVNALFPLPPLAEQKRIVEKLDALLEK